MNATATHPLAQLQSAEAQLVGQLDATAARLDAVGTDALQQAMTRMQLAAMAASERLARARQAVALVVGEVLGDFNALAADLAAALAPTAEPKQAEGEPPPPPTYEEILAEGDDWKEEMPGDREVIDLGAELPAPAEEPAPKHTGFPSFDELVDAAREAEQDAQQARQDAPAMRTGHHTPEPAEAPLPGPPRATRRPRATTCLSG